MLILVLNFVVICINIIHSIQIEFFNFTIELFDNWAFCLMFGLLWNLEWWWPIDILI